MYTPENLPAGYVDIEGAAIHVAKLRKFTTDVNRFRKYLQTAVAITKTEPQSPAWIELVESADSIDELLVTMTELGHLNLTIAEDLRAEAAERRFPS